MKYQPLSRREMIDVIEGKGSASRIPVLLHMWTHPRAFKEREEQVNELLAQYPEDAQIIGVWLPDMYPGREDDPDYSWVNYPDPNAGKTVTGLDETVIIDDWDKLDGILESFPRAEYPRLFPSNPEPDGRYRLAGWWFCLFERFWSLRGMTNALMDFYTDPDSVHRLFRAMTDFYKGILTRGKKELNLDGFFTSDDIGTQTSTFFSQDIFNEFFYPYYKEIIEHCHSLDMHFWLHTCGNIEAFIPSFIEIGLDVLHPIQKYTMDERKIAEKFGKDICIWAGFDVQQTIPWGTPEDVRREVRFMMDTYFREEGLFMFTAGNGINGDCTLPSLEALYSEAFDYGIKKAGK